jgi:hypothetical protein
MGIVPQQYDREREVQQGVQTEQFLDFSIAQSQALLLEFGLGHIGLLSVRRQGLVQNYVIVTGVIHNIVL